MIGFIVVLFVMAGFLLLLCHGLQAAFRVIDAQDKKIDLLSFRVDLLQAAIKEDEPEGEDE